MKIGSVVVTLFDVLIIGYIKNMFTTAWPLTGAGPTAIVGGLAASAGFAIVIDIGENETWHKRS